MTCANHPDRERVAFCQNCGKPLCQECSRSVGTAIFCAPCDLARVNATSSGGYAPVDPTYSGVVPPIIPGVPNPGLAALLGFIPGVGAVYNEQYAKGLVHLMVFAILVSLSNNANGMFGIFVFGWLIYMVVEAHHTARARRDGTPLPNPFGLNDLSERLGFGRSWPAANPYGPAAPPPPAGWTGPAQSATADRTGSQAYPSSVPPYVPPAYNQVPYTSPWGVPPQGYGYTPGAPMQPTQPLPPDFDPSVPQPRSFPTGAIWLIGLGVLFLLGNTGVFRGVPARIFGPLVLIGIGVYVFIRRMTSAGFPVANDGTPAYGQRLVRAVSSSLWVTLTGLLWLLNDLDILSWSRSWPFFIIAVGVLMLVKRAAYSYSPYPDYASHSAPPYTPAYVPPVEPDPVSPPAGTALTGVPEDLAPRDPTPHTEGR